MASHKMVDLNGRASGGTEHSWCTAVPGGTGIAVLGVLLTNPIDNSILENALHNLQISHPILRSKLHYTATTGTYSFTTSPTPFLQIKSFDISSTSKILHGLTNQRTPFHLILEHELNNNSWSETRDQDDTGRNLFFASVYALLDKKSMVALRLHVSACDRTTAVSLLRELQELLQGEGGCGTQWEKGNNGEVSLGIEKLVPSEKAKKALWARGLDMLGYSLNSFKLTNLKFDNAKSPRCSKVVRLQMDQEDTTRLLSGCKARDIKLCAALASAALVAAHSSKRRAEQHRKYGVMTFADCRAILDPPLSTHHLGFYHSAILNIHTIKHGEKLWDIAKKTYTSFLNSKKCNKHFTDMADLNFLMCRAIENPGLTSSSSLRTSLVSVFEDPVFDDSINMSKETIGLEDYMGCASVHGIGPSIAIFDTVRDGRLDCVCVYPSPLHSTEQMELFVDQMKNVLVDAGNCVE